MSMTFRVLRQFYKYNHDFGAVAATQGLSPNLLSKRLEREGTSYTKLLRLWRARWLKTLLDQGKTNMDCLANELGYDSNTTFLLFFKEAMGVSWTEYHRRAA